MEQQKADMLSILVTDCTAGTEVLPSVEYLAVNENEVIIHGEQKRRVKCQKVPGRNEYIYLFVVV
jgi:hypothetical protein